MRRIPVLKMDEKVIIMKNKKLKVLCVAAAVAVGCTLFCGCSDNNSSGSSQEPDKAQSQVVQSSDGSTDTQQGQDIASSQAQGSAETGAEESGGKVKVNDSALGEIWIDRLDGVELNRLDNSGFSSDGVFKQYSENGAKASVTGVDVSSYNGDIDWQRVKDSGVDFAMIRVGGRGYGDSGALYPDEKAAEYLSQAKAAGIKVGAYFFSQATTAEEAAEEAEYSKEVIGDIALDYPLAYDWEIIPDDDARTDSVSAEQATECAAAFCEKAKQLGYTPAIYSTSRELYFKYDLKKLSNYDIWFSEYADLPSFYYRFSIWQYSKEGVVDGIDGTVDLNLCFTNTASFD